MFLGFCESVCCWNRPRSYTVTAKVLKWTAEDGWLRKVRCSQNLMPTLFITPREVLATITVINNYTHTKWDLSVYKHNYENTLCWTCRISPQKFVSSALTRNRDVCLVHNVWISLHMPDVWYVCWRWCSSDSEEFKGLGWHTFLSSATKVCKFATKLSKNIDAKSVTPNRLSQAYVLWLVIECKGFETRNRHLPYIWSLSWLFWVPLGTFIPPYVGLSQFHLRNFQFIFYKSSCQTVWSRNRGVELKIQAQIKREEKI
jgi:hypothetical protein